MSVGTSKPIWHVEATSTKPNPFMYLQRNLFILIRVIPFFSLSQLFLRGPQHPGNNLLISPGRSVISWGVGVRRKSPYSTATRSPPSRSPELSERLPPRSVPGPSTQLPLSGSAAAAATPATAGPRQAWTQGPLRSRVSGRMDGWMVGWVDGEKHCIKGSQM